MASTSDARDKTLRLYNALRDQSPSVLTPEAVRAIAQPLGFSDQAIRESLARLADRDLLMRMSRGRYVFTDAPGAPRVHPFLVATTSVTPSAISHWSALQHWHLTEQIPQQVLITSPRRGMRTPHQTSHQRTTEPRGSSQSPFRDVRVITITPAHFFGFVEEWITERDRVPILDAERAVLDLFQHFHIFGSLSTALEILEQHHEDLDLERLTNHAVQLGVQAVIKRLGWTLEHVGVDDPQIQVLRDYPATEESRLDPGLPARGRHNREWRVIENLSV